MGQEEKPIFTSRHPYHGLARFYHSVVDSNKFIQSCLCASEIWRIVLQWLVVRRGLEVDHSNFICKVSTMVNYAGNDGPEVIARAR